MYTAQALGAAALLAGVATAHPLAKRTDLDPTVLNFALTLEHLENNFYKGALLEFSKEDFERAGFWGDYYYNLEQIAYDEQEHVALLTSALEAAGVAPVAPCTYDFPYTTPRDFVTLSSVIESVGTSAYLGGAPLITSPTYLTVAGSILAVEALHTSYQRAAVGKVPSPMPLQTSLDPDTVYSIAAEFITACPANNTALPFTAFPTLAAPTSEWPDKVGEVVTFTASSAVPAGSYLTFLSGLSVASVQGTISGDTISGAIPSIAAGQTYVLITSTSMTGTSAFNDTQVLAGPAIIEVTPPAPALDFTGFTAH